MGHRGRGGDGGVHRVRRAHRLARRRRGGASRRRRRRREPPRSTASRRCSPPRAPRSSEFLPSRTPPPRSRVRRGGRGPAPPSSRCFWRLRRRRSWRFARPRTTLLASVLAPRPFRPTNPRSRPRCSGARGRSTRRWRAPRGGDVLGGCGIPRRRRRPRAIAPPREVLYGGGAAAATTTAGDGTAASAEARGGRSRGATGPRGRRERCRRSHPRRLGG